MSLTLVAWIVRVVGLLVLAAVGWNVGQSVDLQLPLSFIQLKYVLALIGALQGFFVIEHLTLWPLVRLQREMRRVPIQSLLGGTVGLAIGLLMSVPLAYAAQFLPLALGSVVPVVVAIALGYLGLMVGLFRYKDMLAVLPIRRIPTVGAVAASDYVLLDTSVIIDGRIADVAQTGFVHGTLLVPRFVLNELQHIADSPDAVRRNRGRRGLDVLNKLQKSERVPMEITDMDVEEAREVDSKLVGLAKRLYCPVLTNDYNLNRVAEIQGVRVLNINELANAIKAVVLPGESLRVRIIQEGKEVGQGVGYLDDGTMIVVENGRRYLHNTLDVTVTRVLQTVAGRMIFAAPTSPNGHN
jgi:uncharacterized protein YacL